MAGVILAAGDSTRMGSPKALLRVCGESFVARLVRVARQAGVEPLRVVAGRHHDEIRTAHPDLASLLVHNPDPGLGQLHSLRLGLASLGEEATAALVFLVDAPLVKPETVRAVMEAFVRRRAVIVVPVDGGRRGHPVLFAREVFAELFATALADGARSVVRACPERVHEVEVDDPGILMDVDTPDEYGRLLEHGEPN